MLETRKKTIDGLEYSVTQLGAKEGTRLLTRLLRVAGPAFGGGGGVASLEKVLEGLKEEDIDYLCNTLSRTCAVQTSASTQPQLSDIFDMHFAGNYLTMGKWLAFALEVNFGSFLAIAGDLKNLAANESPAKAQE